MKTAIIAGLLFATALPAAASSTKDDYWTHVWEKSYAHEDPKAIDRHLRSSVSRDTTHFLAKDQLYRITAGLPLDTVSAITRKYGVSRWVGPNSSCTPEDQRQYRRHDSGSIHHASGNKFFYWTFHRVRKKTWDPCAQPMLPWTTRMEQPLRTEHRKEPAS